jgi:hypothetical protein
MKTCRLWSLYAILIYDLSPYLPRWLRSDKALENITVALGFIGAAAVWAVQP